MQHVRAIPSVSSGSVVWSSSDLNVKSVGLVQIFIRGHKDFVAANGLNSWVHVVPSNTATRCSSICIWYLPTNYRTLPRCWSISWKCKPRRWCSMSDPLGCLFCSNVAVPGMACRWPWGEWNGVPVVSITSNKHWDLARWDMSDNSSGDCCFHLPGHCLPQCRVLHCHSVTRLWRATIHSTVRSCPIGLLYLIRNYGTVDTDARAHRKAWVGKCPTVDVKVISNPLCVGSRIPTLVWGTIDCICCATCVNIVWSKPSNRSSFCRNSNRVGVSNMLTCNWRIDSPIYIWLV